MIRDTPVCKAGFEGGDYNSAKAGGSCKNVEPGRSFCCAAFNLAARPGRITWHNTEIHRHGRKVLALYCLKILSSCLVMFYNALLHEIYTSQFLDPDTGREVMLK